MGLRTKNAFPSSMLANWPRDSSCQHIGDPLGWHKTHERKASKCASGRVNARSFLAPQIKQKAEVVWAARTRTCIRAVLSSSVQLASLRRQSVHAATRLLARGLPPAVLCQQLGRLWHAPKAACRGWRPGCARRPRRDWDSGTPNCVQVMARFASF